jgi:hypothetical protein
MRIVALEEQSMKAISRNVIGSVLLLLNKCVDANGRTSYSDRECPYGSRRSEIKYVPLNTQSGGIVESKSESASKSVAPEDVPKDLGEREGNKRDVVREHYERCIRLHKDLGDYIYQRRSGNLSHEQEQYWTEKAEKTVVRCKEICDFGRIFADMAIVYPDKDSYCREVESAAAWFSNARKTQVNNADERQYWQELEELSFKWLEKRECIHP